MILKSLPLLPLCHTTLILPHAISRSRFNNKCLFLIHLWYILFSETPLTLATKVNRCRSLILQLVGGGAHLDFRNKRSLTAVHTAALNGNAEAIKVIHSLLYLFPDILNPRIFYFYLARTKKNTERTTTSVFRYRRFEQFRFQSI